MSHRTPAPCRLSARRRLALGGLVMTGALAAGAVVSTPAFADVPGAYQVHDIAELQTALGGSQTSIELASDFDDHGALTPTTVTVSKRLDLNGQVADLEQLAVADDVELDVVDSTAADGSAGLGSVSFDADYGSTAPVSGVQLGVGAELHVSGASFEASGADGGAGVGATSANASFVADQGAMVSVDGSTRTDSSGTTTGGGAGIGGADGQPGMTVAVQDAVVSAYGGAGAAGIGGGYGGDGGSVDIRSGATVDAEQGEGVGFSPVRASSIGGGQNAIHSGALQVEADGSLETSVSYPLMLLSGATVVNDGSISLAQGGTGFLGIPGATAINGSGTIENHGSITAGSTDPTTLMGSAVAVTGYNYDLTVDPNGGTIAGATHAHLLSGSVSDLVTNGVTPPSDGSFFWKWTTNADGSGTAVVPTYASTDDLAVLGTSTDGSAVPVTLYARFAHAPSGTRTALADATVGRAYDQQLPVSGDGITSYQLAGPQSSSDQGSVLPAGLSIDSTTGRITGTPTAPFDGTVTFDVAGVGENLIPFHLTVGGVPVFATTGLPAGTAGQQYSTTLAVGGSDATTYSVVAGALPAGLGLSSAGSISGTPTGASSATFTVRATNRFGTADRAFTIAIGAAARVPSAPVLGAAPHRSVEYGHQLTLAVSADSTSPVTFALVGGTLPKGVTLDAKTGVISGAPVESGTFPVRVRAANEDGSADASVVITVGAQVDLIKAKPVAPVAVGAAVVPVKVAGFKKGEHWTVRLDGRTVEHGTMRRAGTLSVSVHLGKTGKDRVHTIVVTASRKVTDPAKRAATVLTVTSLSAKKTLKVKSVGGQDGRKHVVVDRLGAGEHVVVKDGDRIIASGRAGADGAFVFPQSKAGKGTSRLTVHGADAKRAGRLTVKNPTH